MIQYFFIFEQNANSIVYAKPKSKQGLFKNTIALIPQKVQFSKMKVAERVSTKWENYSLLMQKFSDNILLGCFLQEKLAKESEIYQMFARIFSAMPDLKRLKNDTKFKTLVKREIVKVNEGRGDALRKISKVSDEIEERVRKETERQLSKASELLDIANEMDEVIEIAKDAEESATEVKQEAWTLNMKMKIFLYSSSLVILALGVLFVVNVFL